MARKTSPSLLFLALLLACAAACGRGGGPNEDQEGSQDPSKPGGSICDEHVKRELEDLVERRVEAFVELAVWRLPLAVVRGILRGLLWPMGSPDSSDPDRHLRPAWDPDLKLNPDMKLYKL